MKNKKENYCPFCKKKTTQVEIRRVRENKTVVDLKCLKCQSILPNELNFYE